MAPMKLEDNMKDRLEERRIAPTGAAWDRISSKLDNEKGKKKSTIVLWSAIAASFVGGALITLFILNNEVSSQDVQVVETPQVELIKEEVIVKPQMNETILPNLDKVEIVQTDIIDDTSTLNKVQETAARVNTPQKKKTQTTVAINKSKTLQIIKTPSVIKKDKINETAVATNVKSKSVQENIIANSIIDDKIQEIVAKVDVTTVTDAEVDELLKNAQREIISAGIFDQNSNKVDANALLLDVEAQIDPETFKDKVFGILKEGFYTARDAVADRNN